MYQADRLARLPRFMDVEARRQAREALSRGFDVISLDAGDPDLPPPPHVVEVIRAAASDRANYGYPTMEIVIDALRGVGIDVTPPRAGIYVWAPVPPGLTSVEFANHLFAATGVVVTPGIGYGSRGEGYVRLSLAGAGPRLSEAMQRLTACWSGVVDGQPLAVR